MNLPGISWRSRTYPRRTEKMIPSPLRRPPCQTGECPFVLAVRINSLWILAEKGCKASLRSKTPHRAKGCLIHCPITLLTCRIESEAAGSRDGVSALISVYVSGRPRPSTRKESRFERIEMLLGGFRANLFSTIRSTFSFTDAWIKLHGGISFTDAYGVADRTRNLARRSRRRSRNVTFQRLHAPEIISQHDECADARDVGLSASTRQGCH